MLKDLHVWTRTVRLSPALPSGKIIMIREIMWQSPFYSESVSRTGIWQNGHALSLEFREIVWRSRQKDVRLTCLDHILEQCHFCSLPFLLVACRVPDGTHSGTFPVLDPCLPQRWQKFSWKVKCRVLILPLSSNVWSPLREQDAKSYCITPLPHIHFVENNSTMDQFYYYTKPTTVKIHKCQVHEARSETT